MSGWKLLDPSSYKYIVSNTKALVRWGCLYTDEANIISYWSCSKFWRTGNKYILAVLCKAKFQVVYHTLYSAYQYCFEYFGYS